MRAKLFNIHAIFAIGFTLLMMISVSAATITVTNTTDSGAGSLRNAVGAAAMTGDTINFNLAGCPCVIVLTSGQILLNKELTINGPGSGLLKISGNNMSRIFENTAEVTISNLTITGGNGVGQGGSGNGGGIYNIGFLTINDSVIESNIATLAGGGIYSRTNLIQPNVVTPNLLINRTDFIDNQSSGGGGLYIETSSEASINNSSFTGNSSSGNGGAILNNGKLRYTGGSISNNNAVNGGGIANGIFSRINDLILDGVSIEQNTATGDGGGILNFKDSNPPPNSNLDVSKCTVINSRINQNTAANGGGVKTEGTFSLINSTISGNGATNEGGGINNKLDVISTASTISGNTAIRGGGIFSDHSVSLTNSTMSGNQATGTAATDGGGAIFNGFDGLFNSTVTFLNSTIAGNSSSSRGGGVFNPVTLITTKNTIFAQNTAPIRPDISGNVTNSQGFNLIGNTSGSGGFVPTDLQNVNPNLGALDDNGGQTQTRALLAGSPAIDAGTNTGAPNTDQRGLSRPMNGMTDIGAYEFNICGNAGVTNTNDSGAGSLRCAIAASFTGDSVDFNLPNNSIITLSSEIVIDKPIVLNGTNANNLTVSGNNSVRVFRINSPTTIAGLTIANGRTSNTAGNRNGGGILNNSTLNLTECALTGNVANDFGGGLFNTDGATSKILRSTFSTNSAFQGGAIYNDSSENNGIIRLINSTISGNTATEGGGIYVRTPFTALTNIINATIAGNTGNGGGINGAATIQNTIIAGNTGTRPDVFGTFTSNGFNLIGNTTGGSGFIASDRQNVSPLLGALGNNGGTTQTRALLTGSPAIDKGSAADVSLNFSGLKSSRNNAKKSTAINSLIPIDTDQRGSIRPSDNFSIPNAPGGDGSDIGAFEVMAPSAASVSVSGRVLTASGRGISRARIVLTMPSGETKTAQSNSFGYYRFTDLEVGQTYVFEVRNKQYVFSPQVLNLTEAIDDLNFTALSEL